MVLLVRSAQKNFLCQERTRIWVQIRCSRHKYVLLRHSSKRRICKYEDIVVWLRNKSCHYAWRTIDGWSIWVFLALSLLSYMRFITYKFFSTSTKDPLLLAIRSILISQNSVTLDILERAQIARSFSTDLKQHLRIVRSDRWQSHLRREKLISNSSHEFVYPVVPILSRGINYFM